MIPMTTARVLFRPHTGLIVAVLLGLTMTCHSDVASNQPPIVLPDGVRLILRPDSAAQTVAIAVFVRTPRDVGPQQNTLGEMVAHALWYGSAERTREWTAQTVDQVGGVLETLRTPDYVAFSCVTVAGRIEAAAGMFCETLTHADFTPEALAHARRDILNERQHRSEDGFAVAADGVEAVLSGQAVPDEQLLGAVSQVQAQEYFRTRYLPAQTIIVVAGGFSPSDAQTDFEAHLFDYDRRARQTGDLGEPPSTRASIPAGRPLTIPGDAAYALVGVPAPRVDNPDYPTYTVLRTLLGSGHASRLFRRLRDRLGLGYRVGATWRSDLSAPMIAYLEWDAKRTGSASAVPALKPDDALKRLNEQLDSVLADPPGEAEFGRARGMAIGQDVLRHERVRDRAFLLGWYEAMGVGCEFDTRLPTLLNQVTRADLARVAKNYLATRVSALALPSTP